MFTTNLIAFPKTRANSSRKGFTLIELLVVIAIIALLIGILLPSLGAARKAGQRTVSTTKLRQIQIATFQYQNDFENELPWFNQTAPSIIGFCQWTFGGKYASAYWSGRFSGLFDVPPALRGLNPYIYPDTNFSLDGLRRQTITNWVTGKSDFRYTVPSNRLRDDYELEAFKSPVDRSVYARGLENIGQNNYPYIDPNFSTSTYEDTGTSFHAQLRWWWVERGRYPGSGNEFVRAFKNGIRKFRIGSDFDPSTMALYGDTLMNLVPMALDTSEEQTEWVDDYGNVNRSLISFFDGHVDSVTLEPGAVRTKDYSFYFFGAGENEDNIPNGNP